MDEATVPHVSQVPVHNSAIRLEEDRLCTLVVISVRPDGTKELIVNRGRLPGER